MAHRFGLNAFGWDIQYPEAMENGLRMGLDAVYSDHVDMMVDVYAATIGAVTRPF
jgi:glycerophosphoryl diester phosphodiesterase